MLDTPMIGMCKCMWLSKERDVTKVVVHSILFVMIKLFSCTTFSDKTSKINCVSPSISSSIERTYHRWVSTMVNWTLTYIWSVVRSRMTQTFLGSVAQLLGIAVLTWILQLFLRKWTKAKRVAHALPYVPPSILCFSWKCICWQFISTRSCFYPPPSLPTSRLFRGVILSIQGSNWLDVCKVLVYISLVVYLHGLPDIWS